MLIINALFDGLTLLVTFGLLSWAIKKKPDFRIPIAILFDFIMASVFACASIYFGLIATEYALSIPQSINILFGKSIDGNSYVLGPYFWVMHTTFIPTAVYLFVIFISWLGKIFLVPIHWFFRVGISSSNPIILTGGLIGFIGALLGFLLLIIN